MRIDCKILPNYFQIMIIDCKTLPNKKKLCRSLKTVNLIDTDEFSVNIK